MGLGFRVGNPVTPNCSPVFLKAAGDSLWHSPALTLKDFIVTILRTAIVIMGMIVLIARIE